MNLIPKIAELLGVEVGEEFEIMPLEGIYRLSDFGLQTKLFLKSGERWESSRYMTPLLTGQYQIKKIPFKPKEGERYWHVYVGDDEIGNTRFTEANTNDLMRVYCGNCFRSEAEAKAHKYEIYEKLTGKKWEE